MARPCDLYLEAIKLNGAGGTLLSNLGVCLGADESVTLPDGRTTSQRELCLEAIKLDPGVTDTVFLRLVDLTHDEGAVVEEIVATLLAVAALDRADLGRLESLSSPLAGVEFRRVQRLAVEALLGIVRRPAASPVPGAAFSQFLKVRACSEISFSSAYTPPLSVEDGIRSFGLVGVSTFIPCSSRRRGRG